MSGDDGLSVLVDAEVGDLIAHYKSIKGGVTIAAVWEVSTSAIAGLVRIVEKAAGNYDGRQKKDAVLAAVAKFYDEVVAPIDIPSIPNFIETRLVDPAVRGLFLKLADGAIEALVNVFNRVGWYDATPGTNNTNGGTAPSTKPLSSGFVPY